MIKNKTRTKTIIASLILILCIAVYFHRVVFSGMALSGTDSLFNYPPYSNYAPPGFEHASNWLLGDQTLYFYPSLYYARESIRHGHLPLWNPYIMMGAPFLSDAQSAVLYPVNTVFYVLPFKIAFAISAFIRLFLAGLGMYLFISALDIGLSGSLFSAITFMFCAFNIVWLGYSTTNVSVFLPWLFFLLYKFIQSDRLKYIAGLALVIGIQFLGGHPETSAYILLAAAIYTLVLLYWQYKEKKVLAPAIKKSGYILTAVIVGFMIASPMLLPFLSELYKSATWIYRSGTNKFFLPLRALPVFLIPGFYGSPATDNWWGPYTYNDISGYVGVIALILAIIAITVRHKDRHVLFFAFIALFSSLIAFGIPPFFQIFTKLPAFSHMQNQRLIFIYQFGMIVLAGFGINIIDTAHSNSLNQTKNTNTSTGYLKTLALKISLLLLLFLILVLSTMIIILYHKHEINHLWTLSNYFGIYREIIRAACFAGILILLLNFRIRTPVWEYLVLGMIVAVQFFDLFLFGHNYNPQVKKDWIYPQAPPSIVYMQKDKSLFRFTAFGYTFLPNSMMIYHISDIRGYEFPVNQRYDRFFKTILKGKPVHNIFYVFLENSTQVDSEKYRIDMEHIKKYLELINVKYISYPSNKMISSKYVLKGKSIFLQNKNYKPRAYLAHSVITAGSPDEALQLVRTDIDALLDDSVVIENRKNITMPTCPNKKGEYITVDSYQPDTLKLTVLNKCRDVLVLSDTYDDGWKVRVDGQRQPILHANYLFRGIILDPGLHNVVFNYKPSLFKLGLIISAIGILMVIVPIFL